MSVLGRLLAASCGTVLLAACAGSGEGLDANGRPIGEGGDTAGVLTPDLAAIQANVFTPYCTGCHAGAGAPQGLRLDPGNSYGSLVGVPSSEVTSLLRVEPGNPVRSYLVQKLEGRAAVGSRMPLGQSALPASTIAVIRQWIMDGAANSPAPSGGLLAVQTVSATRKFIAIGLTAPADVSLVNTTTVGLVRLGAGVDDTEDTSRRVSVSEHNAALILLRPLDPLEPGVYRLSLRGSNAAGIADIAGNALDGDHDGRPGGDWIATLMVEESP